VADQNLFVSEGDLADLAAALHGMRDHLDKQVGRLNSMVESIGDGWHGPAAAAYKALQRRLNDDMARIRDEIDVIAEAVRLSRGGFSAEDLHQMETFKGLDSGDALPLQAPGPNADDEILRRLTAPDRAPSTHQPPSGGS
jgi:WXG100 family type VII secretion target